MQVSYNVTCRNLLKHFGQITNISASGCSTISLKMDLFNYTFKLIECLSLETDTSRRIRVWWGAVSYALRTNTSLNRSFDLRVWELNVGMGRTGVFAGDALINSIQSFIAIVGSAEWAHRIMSYDQLIFSCYVSVAPVSRRYSITGLGSILDIVSKDTEDTALFSILSVSKIHFLPICVNGICI